MTTQAALAAAASARSAASASAVPGWFRTAQTSAFAVGMTLLGASLLAAGGARLALGLSGAVVLAGFAALWIVLAGWWRRRGLVPAPPRLDRRPRGAALFADFAAIALSLATLAATGRLGWAAIVAGWLYGAALWYRLRPRTS